VYKKILVAYDGSPDAEKALAAGITLARGGGAELHAATAVHLPDYAATVSEVDDIMNRAQSFYGKKLSAAVDRAAREGVELKTHLLFSHAGESIVRFAREEGFDLIVVGPHGWSRVRRLLMGSVSQYIVRHAHCSVLVEKG
jgi:nucleotide-binding universal stress UspA family protein